MRGLVAAVIVLGACGGGTEQPHLDASPDVPSQPDAPPDVPVPVAERQLDLLFVIDDSPAMLDHRTNLLANYPNFVNVLGTISGGLPNLHIAVVTTDLGTKGSADSQPGAAIGSGAGACTGEGDAGAFHSASAVDGGYIVDVANTDGTRTRNYTGSTTSDLAAAFSSLADVGAAGCAYPQPLEAAKRALSSTAPAHQGFLRDGALLAIIFIGASDDCSLSHSTLLGSDTSTLGPLQPFRCNRFGHVCAQNGADSDQMNQVGVKGSCSSNESSSYLSPVAGYVTYFKSLKSDPNQVLVAAAAAPTTPYEVELRSPPGGGSAIPAIAHSCSYVPQVNPLVGDPAVRLVELLDGFPNRNTFSTICQQDLSGVLTQIALLLGS